MGHLAKLGQFLALLICLGVGLVSLVYGLEYPLYRYTSSPAWLLPVRGILLVIGATGIIGAVAMAITCIVQTANPPTRRHSQPYRK